MKRNLRWCVGKFISSRGAETPMHFMPLQEFTLLDFLEQSQLFGLRALRKGLCGNTGLVSSLSRLTDGEVFAYLSEMVISLLSLPGRRGRGAPLVVEYSPNVGPVFEYFKLLAEMQRAKGGEDLVRARWTGLGPKEFSLKFEILHAGEESLASYKSEVGDDVAKWSGLCHDADVVVVNHYQAVREIVPTALPLMECLLAVDRPTVFAAFAVEGDTPVWRTTVKGRDVLLPSKDELKSTLSAREWSWQFAWRLGFDENFFLPEDGPRPGLLIGCAGRSQAVTPVIRS